MESNGNKDRRPYEKLEAATRTLAKEEEFFELLMRTSPSAEIANRIVMFSTFYKSIATALPQYLSKQALVLFPSDPLGAASILTTLLSEINRTVRLAAYLCVKGVFPQAVATMRAAVELIGVYTHVWHEPQKARFVADSDSKEHSRAFRQSSDKQLQKRLKAQDIRFRFMYCKHAKHFSKMYSLLSAHFVHGFLTTPSRSEELSCEFVDRATPGELQYQYEIIQALMSMIYMELIECIPEEDWLDEDIGGLAMVSLIFVPTLSSLPGKENPELKQAVEGLIEALGDARLRALDN